MLHVVTFATSDLKNSVRRLRLQAEMFSNIVKFTAYDEEALTANSAILKIIDDHNRGFGLWSWKPYIIQKALENLEYGEKLLYIDVGCELNVAGIENLELYLSELDNTKGILPFRAVPPEADILEPGYVYDSLIEEKWTKIQLFRHLNVQDNALFTSTPQFGAGIIFLKKTVFTVNFIEHWRDLMESRPDLYDDVSYRNEQQDGFVQSRHDQSVFSLLCKLYNLHIYRSAYEYFHPKVSSFWSDIPIGDWARLTKYPIHAKRSKDYGLVRNFISLNFPYSRNFVKAMLRNYLRWDKR